MKYHSPSQPITGILTGCIRLFLNIRNCRKICFLIFGISPILSNLFCQTKFYGTTSQGGSNFYYGTIYHLDTSLKTVSRDYSFGVKNPGSLPYFTELAEGSNGHLYGMAVLGGADNSGLLFEWDPINNKYTVKQEFDNSIYFTGQYPYGSLVSQSGKFYGMTSSGGGSSGGVIFEWDPNLNAFTNKFSLIDSSGINPYGNLTYYAGKFYGATLLGGNNGKGVIFEWDPVTNAYTKKHDFEDATGIYMYGSLEVFNGKLYGMTWEGGSNNLGVIFEFDPASNTYTKKIDFDGYTGYSSYYSLKLYNNKFYGTLLYGGNSGGGVIFEWDPVTNNYIVKVDIANAGMGVNPKGNLYLFNYKVFK